MHLSFDGRVPVGVQYSLFTVHGSAPKSAPVLLKSRTEEDEQNLTFCCNISNSLYRRTVHVVIEYSRYWKASHVCVEIHIVACSLFAV